MEGSLSKAMSNEADHHSDEIKVPSDNQMMSTCATVVEAGQNVASAAADGDGDDHTNSSIGEREVQAAMAPLSSIQETSTGQVARNTPLPSTPSTSAINCDDKK